MSKPRHSRVIDLSPRPSFAPYQTCSQEIKSMHIATMRLLALVRSKPFLRKLDMSEAHRQPTYGSYGALLSLPGLSNAMGVYIVTLTAGRVINRRINCSCHELQQGISISNWKRGHLQALAYHLLIRSLYHFD